MKYLLLASRDGDNLHPSSIAPNSPSLWSFWGVPNTQWIGIVLFAFMPNAVVYQTRSPARSLFQHFHRASPKVKLSEPSSRTSYKRFRVVVDGILDVFDPSTASDDLTDRVSKFPMQLMEIIARQSMNLRLSEAFLFFQFPDLWTLAVDALPLLFD